MSIEKERWGEIKQRTARKQGQKSEQRHQQGQKERCTLF